MNGGCGAFRQTDISQKTPVSAEQHGMDQRGGKTHGGQGLVEVSSGCEYRRVVLQIRVNPVQLTCNWPAIAPFRPVDRREGLTKVFHATQKGEKLL